MTERFPKLDLDDDLDWKPEEPTSTEHASGPQASKKKLPPPLPARRAAEPAARPAAPAEPPKANKALVPAAREAPAPAPSAKPPLPARPPAAPAERPKAVRPAEAKAAPPAPAGAALNLKPARQANAEGPQRPSPGAYHVSSAPQPMRQSSAPARAREETRSALATPPTPAAQPTAKLAPDTVPAMPAIKAPAAPGPAVTAAPAAPPAAKPAPETTAKPQPGNRAEEPAWFSSLVDAAWSEEASGPGPQPAPAEKPSAVESKELTASGVTSVAAAVSKSEATRSEPLESSLCAFWIKKRCFALDVALVGEVVSVDSVVPVPLTPDAFVGLFNLRGTPMALVDLAQVLELDEHTQEQANASRGSLFALVFRSSRLTAAAVIDKMEAVLPAGRESFTRPESADNPMVQGFVEVRHRPGLVVTVLDPARVIERLEKLKYA